MVRTMKRGYRGRYRRDLPMADEASLDAQFRFMHRGPKKPSPFRKKRPSGK